MNFADKLLTNSCKFFEGQDISLAKAFDFSHALHHDVDPAIFLREFSPCYMVKCLSLTLMSSFPALISIVQHGMVNVKLFSHWTGPLC